MALTIKLKAKEKIVINGAVIAVGDQNVVIHFLNDARILREKDILTENEVVGPESRLYFILQLIYIDQKEQARYAQHLPPVVEELVEKYPDKRDDLEHIIELAAHGGLFRAMRLVKKILNVESRLATKNDGDE